MPTQTIRLYHGTDDALARRFIFQGAERLFLTDSRAVARYYAAIRAAENRKRRGAVVQVTVPVRALEPDRYAYCSLLQSEGELRTLGDMQRCHRTLRLTGLETLREVGSAVYSGVVPPSWMRIVEWVRPSRRAMLRERRERVRRALIID